MQSALRLLSRSHSERLTPASPGFGVSYGMLLPELLLLTVNLNWLQKMSLACHGDAGAPRGLPHVESRLAIVCEAVTVRREARISASACLCASDHLKAAATARRPTFRLRVRREASAPEAPGSAAWCSR